MSNLNCRRLIGRVNVTSSRYLTGHVWFKVLGGTGKRRLYPTPLLCFFINFSHTLGKNFFLSPGLVSFAAVLRLVTQRSSSTNGEEERCVTSLRTAEKETCQCMCCKLFVRLCPTSLQRWVTRPCQTWVEMLDTIKASEQPDKKFGLTTNNWPISLFQPESPAKLTTKLEKNMISVKKHNNGNRPLAFSFQLRYLAVYCNLL